MGLRIGGPISGGTLVDAQLVGYVNTSLSFQASATASGGLDNDNSAVYRYGVYLFYNLGYGAFAVITGFPNWALSARNAYNPSPRFTIFEDTGSFSSVTTYDKRDTGTSFEVQNPQQSDTTLPARFQTQNFGAKGRHVHGNDHERSSYAFDNNKTSSLAVDYILDKRTDPAGDSPLESQDPDFTQQLQCPPGDTAAIILPDYRCKSRMKVIATECFY